MVRVDVLREKKELWVVHAESLSKTCLIEPEVPHLKRET